MCLNHSCLSQTLVSNHQNFALNSFTNVFETMANLLYSYLLVSWMRRRSLCTKRSKPSFVFVSSDLDLDPFPPPPPSISFSQGIFCRCSPPPWFSCLFDLWLENWIAPSTNNNFLTETPFSPIFIDKDKSHNSPCVLALFQGMQSTLLGRWAQLYSALGFVPLRP